MRLIKTEEVSILKILLVSDEESSYIWDYFDPEAFKDIELIISCGDLRAQYLSFLVTMIHAPLFYVPGNHNTRYLNNPPEGCETLDDNIIVYKNIRILGFGGCKSPVGGVYKYTEKQMEKRIKKLRFKLWWNKGVDILVAHAPAYNLGDGDDLYHKGFKSFNNFLDKYSPKYFFHGHQHLNYGNQKRIIQYKNTTIVNAFGYHILDYKE